MSERLHVDVIESQLRDEDGLPAGRRLLAILTLCLATAMAVIAQNVVNVGLPQIAAELAISNAASVMIVTAYQLTLAVLVLPLAKLGEQFGFRRVFLAGLAVFVLTSIGCALSRDITMLAVLRAVQGAGAAGVIGVTAALYRIVYPRRLFGRGLGIHAATVATSSVLGPVIAGAILAFGDWPWLFVIFVPLGVAAILVGVFVLPGNPSVARMPRMGAVLFTIALGVFLMTFLSIAHGDEILAIGAQAFAAFVLGWIYLRREHEQGEAAFLPLRLFRQPLFRASVLASVVNFIAQMTVLVAAPFLLRDGYGVSPSGMALVMLAWPIATVVAVSIVELTARLISSSLLGAIGLTIAAIALVLLGAFAAPLPVVVGLLFACGLGFTVFHMPNNRVIMLAAPHDLIGAASGLIGAARLGGQTMGAALAATCFQYGASTRTALLIAAALAAAAAFISASRSGKEENQA